MALAFAKIRALRGSDVVDEYFRILAEANQYRAAEYHACCLIQRTWRRYKSRADYKNLSDTAVLLQKVWRGFQGKKLARTMIEERGKERRMKFYHSMALRIQKIWRGYYSRKVLFDYRKRKAYIANVKKKAAEMRSYLQAHELSQRQQQSLQKEQLISQKVEQIAGRMHHLLSTKHIPGVFFDARLTTQILGPVGEHDPKSEAVEDGYGETDGKESLTVVKLPEETIREARELKNYIARTVGHNPKRIGIRKREEEVPPEKLYKKAQGPFMPRYQLERVVHKPFKPTLRVGTDFYDTQRAIQDEHRQETLKQISNEYFRTLGAPKRSPPSPCLRSTGTFGSIPYGTKTFRETDETLNISQKMFRTIVPPIPKFDEAEGY